MNRVIAAVLIASAALAGTAALAEGENKAYKSHASVQAKWKQTRNAQTPDPISAFLGLFDSDTRTAQADKLTTKQ